MRRAVTADYVQAADVRAPESLGAVVLYTKELKMPTSGFVRFSLTALITVGVATPGTRVQANLGYQDWFARDPSEDPIV